MSAAPCQPRQVWKVVKAFAEISGDRINTCGPVVCRSSARMFHNSLLSDNRVTCLASISGAVMEGTPRLLTRRESQKILKWRFQLFPFPGLPGSPYPDQESSLSQPDPGPGEWDSRRFLLACKTTWLESGRLPETLMPGGFGIEVASVTRATAVFHCNPTVARALRFR